LIIDFSDAAPHDAVVENSSLERTMTTFHRMITASAVAFSTLALVALTGPPAEARTMARSGTYCLFYGEGGTDCSFTSYAQCEATASGQTAECYGPGIQEPGGNTRPTREMATHGF
jgi:Protein of unknown function (DUF3551)